MLIIMKTIITFSLFFFFTLSSFSQFIDYRKNSCSYDLEITFVTRYKAEQYYEDHVSSVPYLNLIINDDGVICKGEEITTYEELFQAINENDSIKDKYEINVAIGIENNTPFSAFTDLICWMSEFGASRFGEVHLYHFDD